MKKSSMPEYIKPVSLILSRQNISRLLAALFYLTAAAAAASAVLSGCTFFEPDKEFIIISNPSVNEEILQENSRVFIDPGVAADKSSIESIFRIKDYKGNVKGSYEWNGNRVYFIPSESFIYGRRYLLEFSGIFETVQGEEINTNLFLSFFYMEKYASPLRIINAEPASGSSISHDTVFLFDFSSSLKEETLDQGFRIIPETLFSSSYNSDYTRLSVSLDKFSENLEVHRFIFNEKLLDISGIPLSEITEFTYFSSLGSEVVKISSVTTAINSYTNNYPEITENLDMIKYKDTLKISFSQPMDLIKTESAVSFSPFIQGRFFWNNSSTLVFIPEKGWIADTVYHLAVDKWAESQTMIPIQGRYDYFFKPDIELLSVDKIEGFISDGFPITTYSDIEAVLIDTGLVPPHTYTFRYIFSHPFISDKSRFDCQNNISIKKLFPPSSSAAYPVYFSWLDNYSLSIKYSDFTPYDPVKNIESYYLIHIRGSAAGLITDNGNYMPDEIRQLIKTR